MFHRKPLPHHSTTIFDKKQSDKFIKLSVNLLNYNINETEQMETSEITCVEDVIQKAHLDEKPNFTQLQLALQELDAPKTAFGELRRILELKFKLTPLTIRVMPE